MFVIVIVFMMIMGGLISGLVYVTGKIGSPLSAGLIKTVGIITMLLLVCTAVGRLIAMFYIMRWSNEAEKQKFERGKMVLQQNLPHLIDEKDDKAASEWLFLIGGTLLLADIYKKRYKGKSAKSLPTFRETFKEFLLRFSASLIFYGLVLFPPNILLVLLNSARVKGNLGGIFTLMLFPALALVFGTCLMLYQIIPYTWVMHALKRVGMKQLYRGRNGLNNCTCFGQCLWISAAICSSLQEDTKKRNRYWRKASWNTGKKFKPEGAATWRIWHVSLEHKGTLPKH